MKKSLFSLVELLVVISIIAVLMGILIPTVSSMRERARITQAKAEMNAIKTAILQFEATYGLLPIKDKAAVSIVDVNGMVTDSGSPTGYARLMQWLTLAGTDADSPNTRKIKFLDPQTPTSNTYNDPWARGLARPYVIYLDHDYDDKVTIPGYGDLNGKVFIYSDGPKADKSKKITSWEK